MDFQMPEEMKQAQQFRKDRAAEVHSCSEGELGVALESLQGRRDLT